MYSWPPRTSTTGWAGATRSRSSRSGRRCSCSWPSCQSLFETIDVAGLACVCTRAANGGVHVVERARARQIHARPAAGAVQVVVHQARESPRGRRDRSAARRGPASARIRAVVPVATMRSPAMATASAMAYGAVHGVDAAVVEHQRGATAALRRQRRGGTGQGGHGEDVRGAPHRRMLRRRRRGKSSAVRRGLPER